MQLAGGDILQYEALKKITIIDYLIKLDNFVRQQGDPDDDDKVKPVKPEK